MGLGRLLEHFLHLGRDNGVCTTWEDFHCSLRHIRALISLPLLLRGFSHKTPLITYILDMYCGWTSRIILHAIEEFVVFQIQLTVGVPLMILCERGQYTGAFDLADRASYRILVESVFMASRLGSASRKIIKPFKSGPNAFYKACEKMPSKNVITFSVSIFIEYSRRS